MSHSDSQPSEPHGLDQPWRIWLTIAVMSIVLVGILLGVLIIPVVQGRGAGLDAYTAICRALGILPGSPARPQPTDRTSPTPVSQVVWTPDVLQVLARADVQRGRAKVQEVCVVCHSETGVSNAPEVPHLAGQSGAAIYKQLSDYRTGSRAHPLMTDIAKALDEAIIADVAAYYAGQPQRNPNPATLAEFLRRSCNWLSWAILDETSRHAQLATARGQEDRSRPQCSRNKGQNTSSSS